MILFGLEKITLIIVWKTDWRDKSSHRKLADISYHELSPSGRMEWGPVPPEESPTSPSLPVSAYANNKVAVQQELCHA